MGYPYDYWEEPFTSDELNFLSNYVTNTTGPVFALINMPDTVKGALFARYSRSAKSLRRLILDEFADDLPTPSQNSEHRRTDQLYHTVLSEYGDDSVAQLGGAHLACEQASNLLTKIIEWHRIASYLEQSTRYVRYDSKLGGQYRYLQDKTIQGSLYSTLYSHCMDRTFDTYSTLLPAMVERLTAANPRLPSESEPGYRRAVQAAALDAVRGMLPAATLSNLGIYASGQSYAGIIMRMRAHPLPEARHYAEMMLVELRKVIPAFIESVDVPHKGIRWSEYYKDRDSATGRICDSLFGVTTDPGPYVRLTRFDPAAESHLLQSICYEHSGLSAEEAAAAVRELSERGKDRLFNAYVGNRSNRRYRPGRAFESVQYRFDIVSDYGAFRDLQRHRMLTATWQELSPSLGYTIPPALTEMGLDAPYKEILDLQAETYEQLKPAFPTQAAYVVGLGYRVRYSLEMNAREAMHLCELRSQPQGHPSYRAIAQQMHRLIDEQAGHHRIASAMQFVDHNQVSLGRRSAEQRYPHSRMEHQIDDPTLC